MTGPQIGHTLDVCRAVRRLGSAAIDMAWVACGRFDGFWELKLHPWDVAAGIVLISEAGGEAMLKEFEALRARVLGDVGRLRGP